MKLTVWAGAIISALLFLIASMVAGRSEETNVEVIPWHYNHPTEQTSAPAIKGVPEDEAAIRKIVADSADAWNRRDAKALAAHISENHDHINVDGAWRDGRAESERALTAALATTRNNMTRSVARVRFVTPDVAVVVVRNEYTDDKQTRKSISTSVLHKMNGIWWNEAFQNTFVQPLESRAAVFAQAASENPIDHVETKAKTPTNSERADAHEDEDAIRKIVADKMDAWNRRDAETNAAFLAENVDHVNVMGAWSSGRAEVEKGYAAALATTRDKLTSTVAKIRFLTADVAVVVVRNEYRDDKETKQALSTWVFHKAAGKWWVEAFQNTFVRPR
ncbi:MAG: SgcJ/EcaC family oxidoreductase [Terriglobales bacterium]